MGKGKKRPAPLPPEFPIPGRGPEVLPDAPDEEPLSPEPEPEIVPDNEPDEPDEPLPPEIPGG